MKISFDPRIKFYVVNQIDHYCFCQTNTYEEALNFVKENWVEGEGFKVEIQAASRWSNVTLCTITDDDPLDEVSPDNRETVKAVLALLAKQK